MNVLARWLTGINYRANYYTNVLMTREKSLTLYIKIGLKSLIPTVTMN